MMSLLMLVFSVSPILAPLTGSFVIQCFGWRAVFWVVTVAALLAVILLATSLRETRPVEDRAGSSFKSALTGYLFLLRERNFLGLTFIGALEYRVSLSTYRVPHSSSSTIISWHRHSIASSSHLMPPPFSPRRNLPVAESLVRYLAVELARWAGLPIALLQAPSISTPCGRSLAKIQMRCYASPLPPIPADTM
jgi:MFS family permease